jgi:hypothetical protein
VGCLPPFCAFSAQPQEGLQQSQYRVVFPSLPFVKRFTVSPPPLPPVAVTVVVLPVAFVPPVAVALVPPVAVAFVPPEPVTPPVPELVELQRLQVFLQAPALINQSSSQKPHSFA